MNELFFENNYKYNNSKKSPKNNFKNFSKNNSFKQKSNKITFQLISNQYIEVSPNFWLTVDLTAIFKEFQGVYIRENKSWKFPFRNYKNLYNTLLKYDNDYQLILEPIPLFTIDFIINSEDLTILNFKTKTRTLNNNNNNNQNSNSNSNSNKNKNNSNNKNSNNKNNLNFTTKITFRIDYTKDIEHNINELPKKILNSIYPFQRDGINFGIKRKSRLLIADEMGVGKTIQAIAISSIFNEDWPVLIICPSSLKYAWRDEIENWLSEKIKSDEIQIIKNGKDNFKEKLKYYIISYDLAVRVIEKIINKKFNFIICDEAHYLKNLNAKRVKLLLPIIQKSKRIILLTGTPIMAKPIELFPILSALRPDCFYNFNEFGLRYCDPKRLPFGVVDWSGTSNPGELHFVLEKLMIRRLKKDVLNQLPPKKRQKIEIQTDSKIVKEIKVMLHKKKEKLERLLGVDQEGIKKMENLDMDVVEFNNNNNKILELESDNKNSKNNSKNNSNKEEEDLLACFNKAYCLTGEAKIKGICEYITYLIDNSCKFLIFAHHTSVLDAIEQQVLKLKIDYIRIDGKVSLPKRQENVNKFQQDENVLVAILGITACATGLTLTKASTVVFAELHFTPTVMIQAEDRVHRIGQDCECVNIHYLVGSETLDDLIFQKLNSKHTVVTKTLDNQEKNLDLEKVNKMGDFVVGDGIKKNINEKNSVVLSSGKNKTLNDFVVMKKELSMYNTKLKRGKDVYEKLYKNKNCKNKNKNDNSKNKNDNDNSNNKSKNSDFNSKSKNKLNGDFLSVSSSSNKKENDENEILKISKNEESMREILSKNQSVLDEIEKSNENKNKNYNNKNKNNKNNKNKNNDNNKENQPENNQNYNNNNNNNNSESSFEINNLNEDDIFNLFKI